MTLNGKVKIDTELTGYYGNSLGGILGDVYMASTVDVKRGAIGITHVVEYLLEITQVKQVTQGMHI